MITGDLNDSTTPPPPQARAAARKDALPGDNSVVYYIIGGIAVIAVLTVIISIVVGVHCRRKHNDVIEHKAKSQSVLIADPTPSNYEVLETRTDLYAYVDKRVTSPADEGLDQAQSSMLGVHEVSSSQMKLHETVSETMSDTVSETDSGGRSNGGYASDIPMRSTPARCNGAGGGGLGCSYINGGGLGSCYINPV